MDNINEQNEDKEVKIHHFLAYSPMIYLIGLIAGFFADILYPVKIIPETIVLPIGFVLIILSPVLILWAQHSSRNFRKEKKLAKIETKDFCKGPYRLTRNPTYLGLFFLVLGFGILANAILIVLMAVISFLIVNFIFLKKEEKLLERKFGGEYLEYKKSVRRWLGKK